MASKAPTQNIIQPVQVDCVHSTKGVWLVKVPKYLANRWNSAPDDMEVGRIKITKTVENSQVKQDVVFQLSQSLALGSSTIPGEEKVPVEHKFEMTALGSQAMYVLKQGEDNGKESLSVIGKVMQRAECTPIRDDKDYLDLKKKAMQKSMEPKKRIIQLDAPVMQNFLPRINHNVEKDDKDKIKKVRKDKDKVLDMLFNAFAKHQYYSIKDLERITQQPITYLKEIMHEICRLNVKGTHKNTWELKPEYKRNQPTEPNEDIE